MTRHTLFQKILIITLLLSLLPLTTSSLILFFNLGTTSARLTSEISDTADNQASEALKIRASQVAESVTDFLLSCENDLIFLSRAQMDQATLLNFYVSRHGEIWHRTGTASAPVEIREHIPLYHSIALIDKHGRERLVIRDGAAVPASELKNISEPGRTELWAISNCPV